MIRKFATFCTGILITILTALLKAAVTLYGWNTFIVPLSPVTYVPPLILLTALFLVLPMLRGPYYSMLNCDKDEFDIAVFTIISDVVAPLVVLFSLFILSFFIV